MSQRQIRRAHERAIEREGRRGRGLARKLSLATWAALGASALFTAAAQADEVVDTTEDGVDGDLCDGDDCTLREAIIEANTGGPDADMITFASNVTGEIDLDDGDEMDIDEELTIQGPGADVLAVDALGQSQIFDVDVTEDGSQFDPVTISGLTLTGGYAVLGGAIGSEDTTLTLTGMVFNNNSVEDDGGAVFSRGGRLTIANSLFDDNYTTQFNGGALAVRNTEGSDADEVEVLISGSAFTNNFADGRAGALYLTSTDGDVVVENTTVSGNDANAPGGGIYFYGQFASEGLTIKNSTVSDNESFYGTGGGIHVEDSTADTVIESSTISGNRAAYDGGGVFFHYVYDDVDTTIRNSTIVDNTAGIDPSVDNGDFGGGGVYLYGETDIDLGPVAISSTIVANNTADFGPDLGHGEFAAPFEVGFSLIESPVGVAERGLTENPAGSNITGQDPQVGALANNGGLTQTHLPALTSPALDAGIANGLATDQRGLPRTSDLALVANRPGSDGTEIGAVEIQAADVEAQCQGAVARKLSGTAGNDTITGTDAAEAIFGLAGADTLDGAGGNDCVDGDEGNDSAKGGAGNDEVSGDAGKDNAKGGPGKDLVRGGKGADRAAGGGGKDKVKGNAGKDKLKGGAKNDKLAGAKGKDTLKGGGGNDRLKGGPGKDKLKGGGGKDRFNCGGGRDKVTAQPKDKVSANCEKVVEPG